jgi:hypothetical protein
MRIKGNGRVDRYEDAKVTFLLVLKGIQITSYGLALDEQGLT